MNPVYFTHPLNGILMILLALGLGIYLSRRFNLGWRLWWIGVATFAISQVGHIPFNIAITALFQAGILPSPSMAWASIFNSIFLGLSAGLWEELARYATYRWWARDARSWGQALMLGAGHGGVEAILLGALVLVNFAAMLAARGLDLASILPPEGISAIEKQLVEYWNIPWYVPFMGALERLFTLLFHLSASVLVLQVFTRRQVRWLWLAIAWHALVDAAAVYAASIWDIYMTEALIGGFALLSLGIVIALGQAEPEIESGEFDQSGLPSPTGAPPALQIQAEHDDEEA